LEDGTEGLPTEPVFDEGRGFLPDFLLCDGGEDFRRGFFDPFGFLDDPLGCFDEEGFLLGMNERLRKNEYKTKKARIPLHNGYRSLRFQHSEHNHYALQTTSGECGHYRHPRDRVKNNAPSKE